MFYGSFTSTWYRYPEFMARSITRPAPVGVVFDFDGTLADTVDVLLEASRVALRSAGYEEAAAADLQALRDLSPLRALEAVDVPIRAAPGLARRLRSELRRRMSEVEVSASVPAFIERLHVSGFILGIMSSNSPTVIRSVIGNAQIAGFFEFVARGGAIRDRARRLRRIVRRHAGLAGHWIYIGDEIRDFEAARQAGVPFVGVGWGVASRAAFEAAGADHVVESWSELADVLEAMSAALRPDGRK
jgi:phosphoglycolate phosphatase